MQPPLTTPAQLCPPPSVLDDLELVRGGALPAPAGELGGWVDLGTEPVEVVDPEGVPLALVTGQAVTWLAERSGRPFEHLHRAVDGMASARTTVVVDHPDVPGPVRGEPLRLLALASTDGEDSDEDLAVARRAVTLAAQHPDAEVVVVPLGRHADRREEKVDLVATAYARGGEVVHLRRTPQVSAQRADGTVLFFTGLSGSGKSTIARAVRNHLVETSDRPVTLLDGDVVRRHLSAGLGFGVADRETNVRRIGWVAAEIARHGGLAICSPIAPFASTRTEVRKMVTGRGGRFVLVHVATPLAECAARDRKGLYAMARRGEIADFTGISSPYQEPTDADLVLDTTGQDVTVLRDRVLALL